MERESWYLAALSSALVTMKLYTEWKKVKEQ